MTKYLRIAAVIILALAIVLSCTLVGSKLTDPATYAHTIEALDENRATVLGLTAASAAASAAISAIPDDICTPIAEEISELTTWFMVILAIVYLEKYLLTIFGAAACYFLIPVGCGALLTGCFFPRNIFRNIGTKLISLALVMLLAIPASIWVSDRIDAIYSESIDATIQSASTVSDNLFDETQTSSGDSSTVIDEAKTLLGNNSASVSSVIEQFRNILNRFIEATAVMIVTTCLIPVLVIAFFVWILKTLFNIPIFVPTLLVKPRRHRHHDGDEDFVSA